MQKSKYRRFQPSKSAQYCRSPLKSSVTLKLTKQLRLKLITTTHSLLLITKRSITFHSLVRTVQQFKNGALPTD